MKYLRRNGTDLVEDDPLTARVVGIALAIYREIGPGFPESIYHRAMEIKLAEAGLDFASQSQLVVKDKDRASGTFAADKIVEGRLLLEFKALEDLPLSAEIHIVPYRQRAALDHADLRLHAA